MAKTFIIAEAGVNHNGSVELALELVDKASEAGADAIKFQTFKTDLLVTADAEKAEYQKVTTDREESQFDMLKRLELGEADHMIIANHCRQVGIEFMSTPFDLESLSFLTQRCQIRRLKLSSGELTNGPMLLAAARTGIPIILSTGMGTLGEIEDALMMLAFGYLHPEEHPTDESLLEAYISERGQAYLAESVSLLHCTTDYPAPPHSINLRAMDTMASAFGLPVGYSDHSEGIAVSLAAVARGALLVEKHFTLDRNLPGPDHRSSLEPSELKAMVQGVRDIEAALGRTGKFPSAVEICNRLVARKSVVAARDIAAGQAFTEDSLSCKRPGGGISAMRYWELLGKAANRDYRKDEKIE